MIMKMGKFGSAAGIAGLVLVLALGFWFLGGEKKDQAEGVPASPAELSRPEASGPAAQPVFAESLPLLRLEEGPEKDGQPSAAKTTPVESGQPVAAKGKEAIVGAEENKVIIGMVVALRGEVTALSVDGERKLAVQSPVFHSDTILTGNGHVQLLFADETLISLDDDTEMLISEYDWQPNGASGAMKTRIKEGTFRVMGGAIARLTPGSFTTETQVAIIGVRGTSYAGRVTPETLSVVLQGGKGIIVSNAAGSVTITTPGFGTRVLGLGQPPQPPEEFKISELKHLGVYPTWRHNLDDGYQYQDPYYEEDPSEREDELSSSYLDDDEARVRTIR
jgi:hypothetical protein